MLETMPVGPARTAAVPARQTRAPRVLSTIVLLLACPWLALAQEPAAANPPQKTPAEAASAKQAPSRFRSPEDGWLDISQFLDTRYGFLPVAQLITEPAVGFGAAGGLAFIKQAPGAMYPNITVVGGLGTENGTKGALAADLRYWLDGRVQTLAGVLFASVNLDFYGIGADSVLADNPLRYELEPAGGLVEAKIRLGGSPVWVGARYAYAQTGVRFDAPEGTPGRPETARWSTEAGITPSVTVDTRNNLFTPTRGTYVEAGAGLFSPTLGGDDSFQRLRLIAMQFVPLGSRLFFGVRGEAAAALGDAPFYLKPFIYQRGVPAMRYLGEEMSQIETELRWQFWKRFSVIGFASAGWTWAGSEGDDRSDQVTAGGAGFRYELARTHGLHVGADVAAGPDGGVFYIQFGSAWAKP
jgi:hypothetical protein